MQQKKVKLQEAIKQFQSGTETEVLSALKIFEQQGDTSILPVVFEKLRRCELPVEKAILTFLADIQKPEASSIIIDFLGEEKDAVLRQKVLTSIWNSKLSYDDQLPFFVMLASTGDFMQALECLTIIENMQGPFAEHELLEAQLLLKEYVEESKDENEQKRQIMSEIAWFIKEQNEGIDADLLLED
ncbi:MAG: hypothetical protein ACKOXP_05615 [Flavobacteriales bacterium]